MTVSEEPFGWTGIATADERSRHRPSPGRSDFTEENHARCSDSRRRRSGGRGRSAGISRTSRQGRSLRVAASGGRRPGESRGASERPSASATRLLVLCLSRRRQLSLRPRSLFPSGPVLLRRRAAPQELAPSLAGSPFRRRVHARWLLLRMCVPDRPATARAKWQIFQPVAWRSSLRFRPRLRRLRNFRLIRGWGRLRRVRIPGALR